MCTNYLAGFCPDGPRCKFVQYVSVQAAVTPGKPLPGCAAVSLPSAEACACGVGPCCSISGVQAGSCCFPSHVPLALVRAPCQPPDA